MTIFQKPFNMSNSLCDELEHVHCRLYKWTRGVNLGFVVDLYEVVSIRHLSELIFVLIDLAVWREAIPI